MIKTDYNSLAATYNLRYETNRLLGIEKEIGKLIKKKSYVNILEAGCGTGNWMGLINESGKKVFGLDLSSEMLGKARHNYKNLNLINADATQIPIKANSLDIIFSVNAIHHFADKEKFINECKRTLSNNGMLAIIGVDPHIDKEWYVYDYFDCVYENDLKRYIALEKLKEMLLKNGFENLNIKKIDEVYSEKRGEKILDDPFLKKDMTSQLANLSVEDYLTGIAKIRRKVKENPREVFITNIKFYLLSAQKN